MENVRSIAFPPWIYDQVELVLGSFGKFFFFETKWSISMAKRYLPQGNFAYHLPSQFLCVDGKQSKSRAKCYHIGLKLADVHIHSLN